MKTILHWFHLASLAILSLAVPVSAAVIFSDNFDGGAAAALNDTTPDTTTGGAKWVAMNSNGSRMYADGGIEVTTALTSGNRGGSATLVFTPQNGFVYTLDVSALGLNSTTSHTTAGPINFGFAKGQSTLTGNNRKMGSGDTTVTGKVFQAFNVKQGYTGANGIGDLSFNATSGMDWIDWTGGFGATIDLRIVLDTTGGTGTWTANWFAKKPADGSYTETRASELVTDTDITSVGFALAGRTESGRISSFSLTAVPEPTAALLGSLGLLALLRRRC
jgi:hypothetical protein